ncbi:hypothetical protein M527_12920 [Sphingobium indicum IP26]|nr:hypothetical protein M527_28415 [Sphingobium indicum IP26]EPR15861.1 hypothetical protein M527_23495 [Sphingobium indicum IP26]EPR17267.1 hypothetical protein M527_17325 [Sphingobium indicum IP26]EPR18390.1 hypothetical protein M527_12920 [Sphingobium indicum IP26]
MVSDHRDDRLLRRVEGMEGGRSDEEAGRKSMGGRVAPCDGSDRALIGAGSRR